MTHASVELIEAMAGITPNGIGVYWKWECACTGGAAPLTDLIVPAYAHQVPGEVAIDVKMMPDCPRCLVAMDAALDGVVLHVA